MGSWNTSGESGLRSRNTWPSDGQRLPGCARRSRNGSRSGGTRRRQEERIMIEGLLGRIRTLVIRRLRPPGAYLAIDPSNSGAEAEGILLPWAEVPDGAVAGAEVEVFVYLDSEDRPIGTTRFPRLTLGEVAFLKVTDVTKIGAFVDWG